MDGPHDGKAEVGAISEKTLDGLIKETKSLGKQASSASFDIKILGFNVPNRVGLGYDPLTRNSNSFVGTILRAVGIKLQAKLTAGAIGYISNFAAWTWWDTALQEFIKQRAQFGK